MNYLPGGCRSSSENTTANTKKGSAKQPIILNQSIFHGASDVSILGGHVNIIGTEQRWRPKVSRSNPLHRRLAENESFSEGNPCSAENMSFMDGTSIVIVKGGNSTTNENISGAAGLDDYEVLRVSNQSMFMDASDITAQNSIFSIVAGDQSNTQHNGSESPTKKVKRNSTPHRRVIKPRDISIQVDLTRKLAQTHGLRNSTKMNQAGIINPNHPVSVGNMQGTNSEEGSDNHSK